MGIGFAEGILKLSLWCIRTDMYGKIYLSASPLELTWWVELIVVMLCRSFIRTYMQADCVFPTRTARFGVALTPKGPLNLST